MKHMRQLDSLRAFAVFAVFTNHWLPAEVAVLPWGSLGVQLFFVLSGFLITGILLDVRGKIRDGEYSVGSGLRRFYARRFFRIFPLFYATLALGWIIGLPSIRAYLPWHALYASNFLVAFVDPTPGETSHFWTLAIEEQFYLLWPCVILLASRRWLKPVFAAMVAAAVLWRLGGTAVRMNPFTLQALPPNTVDFFAFGAYLALLRQDGGWHDTRNLLFRPWVVVCAAAAFVPGAIMNLLGMHAVGIGGIVLDPPVQWERIVVPTAAAVLFVNLIRGASEGFRGRAGRILEHPVLVHMGRISYGLYLLHLPAIAAVNLALIELDFAAMEPRSWALFVPKVLLTVAVALASWHWFEKPMNGLKTRFPY